MDTGIILSAWNKVEFILWTTTVWPAFLSHPVYATIIWWNNSQSFDWYQRVLCARYWICCCAWSWDERTHKKLSIRWSRNYQSNYTIILTNDSSSFGVNETAWKKMEFILGPFNDNCLTGIIGPPCMITCTSCTIILTNDSSSFGVNETAWKKMEFILGPFYDNCVTGIIATL